MSAEDLLDQNSGYHQKLYPKSLLQVQSA